MNLIRSAEMRSFRHSMIFYLTKRYEIARAAIRNEHTLFVCSTMFVACSIQFGDELEISMIVDRHGHLDWYRNWHLFVPLYSDVFLIVTRCSVLRKYMPFEIWILLWYWHFHSVSFQNTLSVRIIELGWNFIEILW